MNHLPHTPGLESGTRTRDRNPNPGPECGARIRNRNQNYKRISKNIKIELEVISRFSLVVTVPNTFPIPYTKTTELWFLHGVSLSKNTRGSTLHSPF